MFIEPSCSAIVGVELPSKLRKAVTDELNTSLQEIFGSQFDANAASSARVCLEILFAAIATKKLAKTEVNKFQKAAEDTRLVATAKKDGEKLQVAMNVMSEIIYMVHYHFEQDDKGTQGTDETNNKYEFIKVANLHQESHSAEENVCQEVMSILTFAKYQPQGEATVETLVNQVMEMRQFVLQEASSLFETEKKAFVDLLEASMVDGFAIPAEVERINTIDGITDEMLQTHFSIKKSAHLSQQTINMSAAIRDATNASKQMGLKLKSFVDLTKYQINHHSALSFLCLGAWITESFRAISSMVCMMTMTMTMTCKPRNHLPFAMMNSRQDLHTSGIL